MGPPTSSRCTNTRTWCAGRMRSMHGRRCGAGGWSTASVVNHRASCTSAMTPAISRRRRRTSWRLRGELRRREALENTPADAVLQRERVEIEQQPYAASTEAQVGKELRLMQREDVLDGFQFQDHLAVDDDVCSVTTIE